MELPKSYDIIGDILIFEVKDKINTKGEKEIANEFLKKHKNVKVVAKRSSIHEGEYRLRKIKILAGEKRKETIYKENGIQLKLNVETCYFSQRTSTERLRIAKEVKDYEDVLVMFSGVAPFPIVISKNSNARKIYGIEINPAAHKYALENVRLNKIKNIQLFEGDVKKVLPELIKKRKPLIGIKSHWDLKQLKSRLDENPELIEIHLKDGDLEKRKKDIEKSIIMLKNKKIKIMIHQPNSFNDVIIDPNIEERQKNVFMCYKILYNLCKKYKLEGFVVHPSYSHDPIINKKQFLSFFSKIKKQCKNFFDYAYLENLTHVKLEEVEELIELAGFENVCIDLSHMYISLRDNKKILEQIKKIKAKRKYFHIADSNGKIEKFHTFIPGKGKIDFNSIKDYIDFGVLEVESKNLEKGTEEIISYKKFMKMIKDREKFDKIVMPLPKTAKEFLPLTTNYIKENGIIYLYLFSSTNELKHLEKKILKSTKDFRIIKTRKVGQYAPRIDKYCMEIQKKTSFFKRIFGI